MKVALILASVVAIAFAGITELSYSEEAAAWSLWTDNCILRNHDSSSTEETDEANTVYFCKDGEDEKYQRTEKVYHVITVTPAPDSPTQVIFVRPPPVVYKHNLTIKGEAGNAIHTKVFVLPQNATHKFEYTDKRKVGSTDQKPTLHFLTDPEFGPYQGNSAWPSARASRRSSRL